VEFDDRSTVVEGMLCSLTVSSPATSLTLSFECLGFEELPEQNQENGKIQPNSATAHHAKVPAKIKERMLTWVSHLQHYLEKN
jgi:hypothetical protein